MRKGDKMVHNSNLVDKAIENSKEFDTSEFKYVSVDLLFYGVIKAFVENISSNDNEIIKTKKIFNSVNLYPVEIFNSLKEKVVDSLSELSLFTRLDHKRVLFDIDRYVEKNKPEVITLDIYAKVLLDNKTELISSFCKLEKEEIVLEDVLEDKNQPETDNSIKKEQQFLEKIKLSKFLQEKLSSSVFGQDEAILAFTNAFFKSEIKTGKKKKPKATFLFTGSPGCGKTYLAELIAENLNLPYARFNMSEYGDKESNIEFAGIDKSYKAAKMGNVTSFVHNNPKSVVIFDEVEKAHYVVLHLFLQILDAGGVRDNYLDEIVSFEDTIIIFTSNAGRNLYEDSEKTNLASLSKKVIVDAIKNDYKIGTKDPVFPEALISRFSAGNIIMFNKLTTQDLLRIAQREFKNAQEIIKDKLDVSISYDKKLPFAVLFSEGNNADARTISGKAEALMYNEVFEFARLIEKEQEGKVLSSVKNINIGIEESKNPIIKDLFSDVSGGNILVFGDINKYPNLQEVLNGYKLYFATNINRAKTILSKNNISLILCDFTYKIKGSRDKVVNLEDINSEGRDFFVFATETISKPVIVLHNNNNKVSKEEILSLTTQGAREVLNFDDTTNFKNQVIACLDNCYREEKLFTLIRSNKVLKYKTSQEISYDGVSANINLYDLSLEIAVDYSESKDILGKMQKPDVKFADIYGAEDAKSELKYFKEFLLNPLEFVKKGVKAPKGVLLYGPPGTGKTMLAKAMAGESDVAFISAEGNEFACDNGIEKIHTLFKKARKYAPAIVFIDEIDALGKDRRAVSTHQANILTAFLTEMDGFKSYTDKPVFVLGATNYGLEGSEYTPLDSAFLRRFDRKILVDLPSKEDREKYIKDKAKKHPILKLSLEQIANIAIRSTGMSLAELDLVIEYAMRNAIKNKDNSISDEEFDDAFESYNSGEKKVWDAKEVEKTARHEAGHAFIAWNAGLKISYLTIISRGNFGGYMQHGDEDKANYTKSEIESLIRVSLGGRAAEMVYYGNEGINTGASSDIKRASELARSMICNLGMDEEFGMSIVPSEFNIEAVRRKTNEIMLNQLNNAKKLITDNKEKFDKLVDALVKHSRLTGEQVAKILNA